MATLIANLYDDFNDGVIDTSKWSVTGSWSEATGTACATMPSAFSALLSVGTWSLKQSAAFIEVSSYANGAGAASGLSFFRMYDATDPQLDTYLDFLFTGGSISLTYTVNAVAVNSLGLAYNPVDMRWLRFRESSDTLYWETSPDGSTWTQRFSIAAPAWLGTVRASFGATQSGGAATTKCFDNFNVASASARPVAVGSEFTVGTDGKLRLDRCGQVDQAWGFGFGCATTSNNGLRKSNDPCGLWVQPPAEQLIQVENVTLTTTETNEQTIITLNLTNPDTCRTMLFYLPLTAGMKMVSTKSDNGGTVSWTLGCQVTGVDNPDSGFSPLVADDLAWGGNTLAHLWRGTSDYYWTAGPGATTSIVVKLKVFSGDTGVKLSQLQARLGVIGMSQVV